MSTPQPIPWHSLPPTEMYSRLNTDPVNGLPQAEVERRLREGGANVLSPPRRG